MRENTYPIKVAAYCRVSSESEEQAKSLELQVRYYTEYINKNPDWAFAVVYAERRNEADFSKRSEFNRMMEDAKVDKLI